MSNLQGPPTLEAYIAARNAPDPEAETTYFVRAEPLTGEILAVGRCSRPSIAKLGQFDGGLYIATDQPVDSATAYVNLATTTVEPRTDNPAFASGRVLNNLPLDGTLIIRSTAEPSPRVFDINETSVMLEFAYPGTYEVVVKSVRHVDATFHFEVPA
jgi:hypothetical protein